MKDFTQKKKIRQFMQSWPVLLLLFVVFCFMAKGAFVLYQKETEVRGKANEVKAELVKLNARKSELENKVNFLSSERGKEEEMRNRFMVGKEGEGVILVVDQKPTTTEKIQEEVKQSWWSGFLNFFR